MSRSLVFHSLYAGAESFANNDIDENIIELVDTILPLRPQQIFYDTATRAAIVPSECWVSDSALSNTCGCYRPNLAVVVPRNSSLWAEQNQPQKFESHWMVQRHFVAVRIDAHFSTRS